MPTMLSLSVPFLSAVLFCLHFQHGVGHVRSPVSPRRAAIGVSRRAVRYKRVSWSLIRLSLALFIILGLAFVDRGKMGNFIMANQTAWTLSCDPEVFFFIDLCFAGALTDLHVRHVNLNYFLLLLLQTLFPNCSCRFLDETGGLVIFNLRWCLWGDIHRFF